MLAAQTVDPAKPAPVVLLLALNYRPSDNTLAYAAQLREHGVEVDMVVPEPKSTAEVEIPAGVRVHPLMPRGEDRDQLIRHIERLLVYRIPRRALAAGRRLTRRRPLRPLDSGLAVMQRAHGRVARGVHNRLFMPFYRHLRPWLLAKTARDPMRAIDVAAADRIVAGDVSSVALGWRLARHHPRIPATTRMDAKVYEREPAAG